MKSKSGDYMKSLLLAAASVLLISGSAMAQSVDATSAFIAGYAQALNDIKESTQETLTPAATSQSLYPSCVRYRDQCFRNGMPVISVYCNRLSEQCSRELRKNPSKIKVPATATN